MNLLVRIIQMGSYVVGLIALVAGVVLRLAPKVAVGPRGAMLLAVVCFACAIASDGVAAQLPKAEEKEEVKTRAAAA